MKKSRIIAMAVTGLLVIGGLSTVVMTAGAQTKSTPAPAPAVAAAETTPAVDPPGANVQVGDQTTPDTAAPALAAAAVEPAQAQDKDNLQQGDQTTPDTAAVGTSAAAENTAASEATGESTTDPANEAGVTGSGYADTNANADTQQEGAH